MSARRSQLRGPGSSLRGAILGLVAWGACAHPSVPDGALTPSAGPPAIVGVTAACDRDLGRWRWEVATDAWAGGGVIRWSVDGAYVEQHATLRSIAAARDGTSDLLRADLSLVEDFRAAGVGGATAFVCKDRPSGLLWVAATDGAVAACVRFGDGAAALAALPDTPPCEEVVAPYPEPTTDTDVVDTDGADTDGG